MFDFGKALDLLKIGKLVARKNWNGKNMFIFMRPSDELNEDFIIDKVKSLPISFKEWVKKNPSENGIVKFNNYLCLKSANNEIINGWIPSQSDIFANDWFEFIP